MSKIYETTIRLNAALGRQYAQTFAAAQKLTNGFSSELVDMQTKAANMSGLAALGGEIQDLMAQIRESGESTEEQKQKLKYLANEYNTLSQQLTGTRMSFDAARAEAERVTDAFEQQEIAAKSLEQMQQALSDVDNVIAQRKELERLKKLYKTMPNKQLAADIKAQEKALNRLENQTGLTGRSIEQLERRQAALHREMAKKKFANQLNDALGKVHKGALKMADGIGVAMKAVGASLVAAGVAAGAFANETGQKLADTEMRARQFGMSTDMFQGFEYSMKKNGVERDQYIDGLQTLQERMVEALKEPGEMRDNFEKLGITMDDLKTKNVGEIFEQMAGNAHMLTTEAEQTKMGLDMLGGEGGKIMASMAKNGIAGMQKDFDEAKRMGAVATQEQIKNAAKYQEQVNKMSAAWDGVKMTIGNAVLPVFSQLMEKVGKWLDENPDAIQKIGDAFASMASSVGEIFTTYIIPYIVPTIEFFKEWGPLLATVAGIIAGMVLTVKAISVAMTIFNVICAANPIVLIIMAIIAAVAVLAYFIIKYWDQIKRGIKAGIDFIVNGFKWLGEKISGAWNAAIDWVKGAWNAAVEWVSNGVDAVIGFFTSIPDKIAGIKDGIAEIFSSAIETVKGGLKSGINWIIKKINSISFTAPDWIPEIGGQTIGFDLPLLAEGGIVTKATHAIVGEGAEPEAIMPLSKLGDIMGGVGGGMTLNVTQNISIGGAGDVESQARKGAAAGANDLASQLEAVMRRQYRLAM